MNNVYFSGVLFDDFGREIEFRKALDRTIAYGIDEVGGRTPVRTGNLKNNWDSDDTTIFDDVYYGVFVEEGTRYFSGRFFLLSSLLPIELQFVEEIVDALEADF